MNKFLSHVMSDELVNDIEEFEWEDDDCNDESEEDWGDFDEIFEKDLVDDSHWPEYDDE